MSVLCDVALVSQGLDDLTEPDLGLQKGLVEGGQDQWPHMPGHVDRLQEEPRRHRDEQVEAWCALPNSVPEGLEPAHGLAD